MDFRDVELLQSRDSFHTTFQKNCHRGKSLMTTTCLKPAVGGCQEHDLCKIRSLQTNSPMNEND